jgi:hypothetical protein
LTATVSMRTVPTCTVFFYSVFATVKTVRLLLSNMRNKIKQTFQIMLDSVLITVMYQFEGAPMLSLPSTVSFTVSGQTPPHAPYSCRLQHMGGAHTNYHHRKLLSPSTFVSFSFLLNPDRIRAGWGGRGAISDAVGSEESSPASRSLGGGGRRDARTSQRDATSGERRVESAATP